MKSSSSISQQICGAAPFAHIKLLPSRVSIALDWPPEPTNRRASARPFLFFSFLPCSSSAAGYMQMIMMCWTT